MVNRGGRKALDPAELRVKSWRRMITVEQWLDAQAYLSHHNRSMADVVWRGPPLKKVCAEGRKIRAGEED